MMGMILSSEYAFLVCEPLSGIVGLKELYTCGREGILGNIDQTFDGQELYPGIEGKAAHLPYFVIKDHPFSDGDIRIDHQRCQVVTC